MIIRRQLILGSLLPLRFNVVFILPEVESGAFTPARDSVEVVEIHILHISSCSF
jgi:hypothetical protein